MSEKSNVGMAQIADDRLERLAAFVGAKKVTPAAVPRPDVPGTGPALLGGLRQVDALLAVADGFSDARPGGRHRDAEARAARGRPRSRRAAARAGREAGEVGRRGLREEAEVLSESSRTSTRASRSPMEGRLPAELDPLTTKPLIAIENGPAGIDCKLEAELAELPDEEAAGTAKAASALDEVVRRLQEALGLITFFTVGEKETRAWTLRDGQTALEAAGTIHSDIARASSVAR